MAKFEREDYTAEKQIKRLQADMRVEAGAGALKYLQAVAQDNTDGKFYAYAKGDTEKGTIVGLYTGEDITAVDGNVITITTQAIVGKEDIVGITWAEDFKAVTMLKQSGIILAEKIEGTKEA